MDASHTDAIPQDRFIEGSLKHRIQEDFEQHIRATRINDLLAQWHRKLAGHSTNTLLRVLGLLAANPFVTITGAANQLSLAFTTAQRDWAFTCETHIG